MKSEYEVHAEKVLEDMGVTFTATYLRNGSHFIGERQCRDIYCCVFRRGKKTMTIDFGQSIQHSDFGKTPPTAYDVLACLTKASPEDYYGFCADYGYDPDRTDQYSRLLYKAVVAEWKKMEKFFAPEEIEILQDIQ